MQILQSTVALCQQVSNVLGKPQKQKLRQHFDLAAGKETLEIPIVLQLSEGTLCLNRTVAAQQLSFLGGNVVIRIIAQILKFPADKNFFALFAVFSLAGNCPGKCVAAVSWRATNGRPYTRNKARMQFLDGLKGNTLDILQNTDRALQRNAV